MKKEISLYVHIPFCEKKCNYCDFLSFSGSTQQEQTLYLNRLFQEIDAYREIANEYEVMSVFIGGGTPSILQEGLVEQLFHKLYSIWKFSKQAEITIEANPGTLTPLKLIEYRTCGINRLSLGLQSANNDELKCLGRIHNYEQFVANYKQAREAGFRNINVDIMAALPGQTLNRFGRTLAKVAELQPEHISVYSLIVEENTPLSESPDLLEILPDEQVERKMYHYTKSVLNGIGYERYEISNYAKPEYACRHNQVYWTGGEYLGLGLGAASYMNGIRFENTKNLQEYLTDWGKDGVSAIRRNQITDTKKSRMEEFMFLGLRLMKGVSKREFERRFEVTMEQQYGAIIQKYMEQGLLKWNQEYLQLTERGIDISNYVLADFLLESTDENV